MSKSSWLFLCLTLISVAFGLQASAQEGQITAFIASAVFAVLLVLTLIVGRRIKFDPVLR
ncbi:PA3371 family protein [Pseudomonas sp. Leaf59]|uniref:PA3371 family protein n=1 Tax=Pseudomonas sp. Leaf59 TaxID=2876556 RepID=UPI001E639E05|nr:PA3371 family protein [Pseudomonas sp. Leaf59]